MDNLQDVVCNLNTTGEISENVCNQLEDIFYESPLEITIRFLTNTILEGSGANVTREKYPPIQRQFASTLQFYSTRAYEYVRKTFDLALPHPSVIRYPLSAIKAKAEGAMRNGKRLLCNIAVDEMAICACTIMGIFS